MINENSIVRGTKQHVSSEFMDGEVVILNLNDGVYYGLDPVGARVWELLQETGSVSRIRDTLLEEYEVSPEQCVEEILALLHELQDYGLVEVTEFGQSA